MTTKQLSQPTLDLIDQFLHLKFNGKTVTTPYFNNRRAKIRGALRVLVGKGNIKEIKEELKILSLREKVDLRELSEEQITKFIVDHNIGIDCSGFAYYILNKELKAQKKKSLKKILKFPHVKNPLRKILTKLRPAENCNVKTFVSDKNSKEIKLKDIQPGDMIILLNAGIKKDYNHVMIISGKREAGSGKRIFDYVHSFKYPSDGQYNHGVRKEQVEIIDLEKNILEQDWKEEKMREYIKTATNTHIMRLKIL